MEHSCTPIPKAPMPWWHHALRMFVCVWLLDLSGFNWLGINHLVLELVLWGIALASCFAALYVILHDCHFSRRHR